MVADSKLVLLPLEKADPQPGNGGDPEERGDRRVETPPRPESPAQQQQPVEAPSAPEKAPEPSRRSRVKLALIALLPFVLIGGGYWYVTGGKVMSIDDAYVEAETVGISTDVSGIVIDVDVSNNQQVEEGQLLYRLRPLQFQIALDNSKAILAQTALTIDAMKEDYTRMLSDAAAQQGQVDLDQVSFDRNAALLPTNDTSKATYDQARFTLQLDEDKLRSLRELAAVQLLKLAGNRNIPVTQDPQYMQAKAQVDETQRQLDHTFVKAPFRGVVTNVPSITSGTYLAASTTAFYLVDGDHLWVDATPKETELTYVRPGQPVTVTVDTYPNAEWRGVVQNISPAAAQQFSLLPAQNTSGNWVKVVQRILVRVRVDTTNKNLPQLRAGMSVEADVETGHARGFPHFLTALFARL
jgi:membrane fusion protein, multidrug efflux system